MDRSILFGVGLPTFDKEVFFMTENLSQEIVTLRKFIIEQLSSSNKYGIDYKYCLDYLHNYRNDKYRQMVINRIRKNHLELYKEASTLISKTDKWIYDTLKDFSASKRAELLNNTNKLMNFLSDIHDFIKEQHCNVFVHRT